MIGRQEAVRVYNTRPISVSWVQVTLRFLSFEALGGEGNTYARDGASDASLNTHILLLRNPSNNLLFFYIYTTVEIAWQLQL
jgi:hypothetical protein